jgi:hypothetical protein
MSTRRPAPGRRLDPVGPGRRRGRRPRRLAARVGVVAGLLLGAALAATAPGLLAVALVIALAWPVTAGVTRRRAAVRRLAIRRDAAPAVLDLLGAALLAGLNPHKAVLRVAERAPDVLREDLGWPPPSCDSAGLRRQRSARPPTAQDSTSSVSRLPPSRSPSAGVRHRRRPWPPGRRPSAAVPGWRPRPRRAGQPSASPSPSSSASCPPSSC